MEVLQLLATKTDDEKFIFIEGYEEFERRGELGDHPLRRAASELIQNLGIQQASVTVLMERIALECYREFARRWLKENEV